MLNKTILIGFLGSDPTLRVTPSGRHMANLRLATSERYKSNGEWVEKTEWHNVVVWGPQAEAVHKYCEKGRAIAVEGKLQTRKWQDKEGNDRYITEIVAMPGGVKFLGSNPKKEEADSPQNSPQEELPFEPPVESSGEDLMEDSKIPF